MKNNKLFKVVAIIMLISMVCTSCRLFSTQKMIDNIIPDHNMRIYTIADFFPYNYKEIKNARALYGVELQEFFYDNTSTESESKRETVQDKNKFYKELMYRTHNYKIIKNRYNMYLEDDSNSQEYNESLREKEFKEYYKLKNAVSENVIKKYNGGKLNGMPIMSIRAIMDTATVSDVTDMYTEVLCEIYKPVIINGKDYEKLSIGDKIVLDIPATNSTVDCSETIKREFTYVATDSLLYYNDNNEKSYYFIADVDGTNDARRVLDYYGKTLETYVETKPLQFMKFARVAEANDITRLLSSVVNENLEQYDFDNIVEKALCGGYLVYKYKDYVYANSITTNLKGYITSLTEYTNQRIDNEYYKEIS